MPAVKPTNWDPRTDNIAEILARAEVEDCQLVPSGSNYVFLLTLRDPAAGQGLAIYKPRRGEAPLWDFPDGTLYRRERAAYLLAVDLGWEFIPPTIIRDGPYGLGMVQLFIPSDPADNFFTIRDAHGDELRRIALFDAMSNNADRKGGHCLLGSDGTIWGIDHGLTFHPSDKLRTVIWDYSDDPLPPGLVEDVAGLATRLDGSGGIGDALSALLDHEEIVALRHRIRALLREPYYPRPGQRRSVPWPPV
jgi:uncharacterized repeat protein (TIGR03843 family)